MREARGEEGRGGKEEEEAEEEEGEEEVGIGLKKAITKQRHEEREGS